MRMTEAVSALRQSAHLLPEPVAQLVRDDAFERAARAVDVDPAQMAHFAMEALAGAALDPLQGDTLEAFCKARGDQLWFTLELDRINSPFSHFLLHRDDPLAQALRAAIEANLASARFRAAACTRRLEARARRLRSQARERTERVIARERARIRAELRANPAFQCPSPQARSRVLQQAEQREAQATAEAYERLYTLVVARLRERINAVARKAAPALPGSGESAYAAWLGLVCYRALRPRHRLN